MHGLFIQQSFPVLPVVKENGILGMKGKGRNTTKSLKEEVEHQCFEQD
jgi:hypothetical protein